MERDKLQIRPPETPPGDGEKKEKKRRKRRRTPSHVPLQVEAESRVPREAKTTESDAAKKKKQEKRPEKPEESTRAKERERLEKPEVTEEKSDHAEQSEEAKKTEIEPEHLPEAEPGSPVASTIHETESADDHGEALKTTDEEPAVIPLEADEFEEELFVSDRYRRQNQSPDAEIEAEKPVTEVNEDIDEDDDQSPAAAHTATTTRPAPASAATATATPAAPNTPRQGGGNVPPRTPNTPTPINIGGNVPPVPPYNPNIYPGGGGGNILPAAPIVAAANRLPNPNVNTVNQFQERRGNGRAILAGILIGGLIEHIRHKRRAKRVEKAHVKEVKELNKDHQATREQLRQAEVKGEETKRKQTVLEKQLERLRKAPTELMPLTAVRPTAEMTPAADAALKKTPEQPRAELLPNTPEEAIKKAQAAVEQARKAIEEEQAELPPDRRIETSAWHRIEIDKKTGKAVETPTIAYGEEFQREQHQEHLRRAIDAESVDSKTTRERDAPAHTATYHDNSQTGKNSSSARNSALSAAAKAKDQATKIIKQANPVDVGLWVVLLIVIWLIVIAL